MAEERICGMAAFVRNGPATQLSPWRMRWRATLLLLLSLFLPVAAVAQPPAQTRAGEVRVGPRTAFIIEAAVAGISAEERAEIVNRRIRRVLEEPQFDPTLIEARFSEDAGGEVILGDFVITGVSRSDALVANTDREQLTEEWARTLRSEITQLKPLYERRGTMNIRMLSEHRVLLLILQVAVLLLAARVCGEIMARLGQPAVIGQLLAGILLGHSVLGSLFPDMHALVFPVETAQSYLLEVVSWIGVIFLLMLTGLETDLNLIRKQGKPAVWASVTGIFFPFLFGFGAVWLLPEELLTLPDQRLILGLFLGTALSISSVPVIAKILMDMKLMRRNVGQIILAAAIADDTMGWIILAVVAGLAASGVFSGEVLVKAVLGTLFFIGFSLTLGRRITFGILRWVNDHATTEHALLTTVMILMLVSASITQFIGVHAVLGAFIFGVVLNTSPLIGRKLIHPIEAVTNGIFAPVFFATAGLYVNLAVIFTPSLLIITVLLTLAACAGKIVGCYGGGRLGGLQRWEAISLGLGMNARGAMGLIIAILGFSLGILTINLFSIIVVMALLTTAMTPPLLRWSLAKVVPGEEEQLRLRQEEQQARGTIGQLRRVLLPTRGSADASTAAELLGAIAQHQPMEVTALHVSTAALGATQVSQHSVFNQIVNALNDTRATLVRRTVQSRDPALAILQEASRGYDMVALGCGKTSASTDAVFGSIADQVTRQHPHPVLVLHASADQIAPALRNILVPTTGVPGNRQVMELAVAIARTTGASITALVVVEQQSELLSQSVLQQERTQEAAQEAVSQAALQGEAFGVLVTPVVRRAEHAAPEIVRYAQETEADLIILSGSTRPSRQMFMGHTVAYILNHAHCAVAVWKPQQEVQERDGHSA